jgi:hypothetical protein
VDIPPALLQLGSPVLLVIVLWWALAKGNLSTSREVDDVRAQRDRADARAERLLDINAIQSEALRDFARKEDSAVRAIEALKDRAAEKDGA